MSPERMARLAEAIHDATVPVAIWVGPSGSGARPDRPAARRRARHRRWRRAPASATSATPLPVQGFELDFGNGGDQLRAADHGPDGGPGAQRAAPDHLGPGRAGAAQHAPRHRRPRVPGQDPQHGRGASRGRRQGRSRCWWPSPASTSCRSLPRLMHTVASPPVTYLLLTIGLSLLIFEFFTAGVGVAGVVGRGQRRAGLLRPRRAADQRLGAGRALRRVLRASPSTCRRACPRAWTGVGARRSTPAASWFLFRDGLRPSWITLLAGIGGVALAFIVGMPSMVRARFATPTIGREWMIGELGVTRCRHRPDGVAVVRGAQWRARTNRATPTGQGRAGAGRRHRRLHARGGAGGGRGQGPPGAAPEPRPRGVIGVPDGGSTSPARRRSPLAALPRSLGGFVGADARRYRPRPARSLIVNLSTRTYAALRNEGVSP